MHHAIFEENESYKIALLFKPTAFRKPEIERYYVKPLAQLGVAAKDQIAFTLRYDAAGKAPVKIIKEYLEVLLKALTETGTTHLYVTDGAYFKVLTKQAKAEVHHGYTLPCAIKGYEHLWVTLGVNYQQVMFDPSKQPVLELGLKALSDHYLGNYKEIGSDIIHQAVYPEGYEAIKTWLQSLHQYPRLKADIEGFALEFKDAGIGTIGFAWNQHEGGSFCVDYKPLAEMNDQKHWGENVRNEPIRQLLREFFETYKGNITWHHASYDVKVLIYQLWMKDPLDREGMLKGLDIMCRDMDDTRVIAYLATNSTAGNVLGLKALAHEFAGNYAKDDIKDIRLIPKPELLKYNLVDCLSTWFVENKWRPVMIADKQLDLYNGLFKDSQKVLIQTELVGMPMCPDEVKNLRHVLTTEQEGYLKTMMEDPIVHVLNGILQTNKLAAINEKLKTKQHPLGYVSTPGTKHYVSFNPNSNEQLQILLFELMQLPVLGLTEGKQPETGGDTIEELMKMPIAAPYKHILEALFHYGKVTKIISGFLPAFEAAFLKADGRAYLHGSFNLGGTVSGRLSSSDPNLQNLPAGSAYGKAVKAAFKAALGWIMCGADFNSLEDYISALTSKDPNKLKVYEQGFDGHALRAAFYFKEKLEAEGIFIDVTDPKSVNQLKKDDHPLRQESKAPTFALTYQGTFSTLMRNCGFSKEEAKAIEANYHTLYQVSDKYIADRLQQATRDGYVDVAFGLRVRTPLLAQSVLNTRSTLSQAAGEGRTAGNAMGQSYGLLNNRAAVATMKRVWASKYRLDIMPIALIHDAIYFIVREDAEIIAWLNNVLIEEMQWQELPEIQHETVKLGAALDLFYPSWAKSLTLPNKATPDEIRKLCKAHMKPKEKEAA